MGGIRGEAAEAGCFGLKALGIVSKVLCNSDSDSTLVKPLSGHMREFCVYIGSMVGCVEYVGIKGSYPFLYDGV